MSMISKPCMHSIVTVLRITYIIVVGYLIQKGYSGLSLQRKFLLTYTKCSSLPVLHSMLLSYHIIFSDLYIQMCKDFRMLARMFIVSNLYNPYRIEIRYNLRIIANDREKNGNILIIYYITNITLHFITTIQLQYLS